MILLALLAGAVAHGPTVVSLQLSTGFEAPHDALDALRRGLEEGGEPAVLGPPSPADCAGRLACIHTLLETSAAQEVLFVVFVGLEDAVQVAATRATSVGAPRDLPPALVPRSALQAELIRLGRAWAEPRRADPAATSPPQAVQLDESGPGPVALVAGGLSGASLVAGIALGIVALETRRGLLADGCEVGPCDPERAERLEREAVAADVLLVTAGVTAAVAVIAWWLEAEGS